MTAKGQQQNELKIVVLGEKGYVEGTPVFQYYQRKCSTSGHLEAGDSLGRTKRVGMECQRSRHATVLKSTGQLTLMLT
jgi:hypothetical protein